MGSSTLDQVEPRRALIEQSAKDVRYLDVWPARKDVKVLDV
jgi:hypothetical protein